KKDGQVIMVRNGTVVEAHQWSSSEARWIKVGEVVDAVGSNRKQVFEGREYDYVFDIEIGEGAPPLKLPFNVT
ncbi:Ubiquitin homeostasis protein lub1, partial [Quaeritorhiza haematococci]